MKHCTGNIGWYIGKFMLNISGILFIYWGFLKEKDIKCYCGAIERESQRDPNKKENYQHKSQSRCLCRKRRGTTYPCGCDRDVKKNLIGKSNKLEMLQSEDIADDGKTCNCSRR
ncbi:hypothetical protein PV327_009629 [Microctonus hyperodae]|uniref:Uncharacterized protein n=1 Tax=Microctonus hyperodae TaxID=165561 RepID=A0AA39EZW5_MICHY|nr:hypothetical protein PV327_009629 [Microctonus hyperodae]